MFGLIPYKQRNGVVRKEIWDPFNVDGLLSCFFNDSILPEFQVAQMKVDVKDTGKEYVVEAELPGVNKEDVEVQIKDGVLTITASQNKQVEETKDNYVRRERYAGTMSRSFPIPDVVEEDISAKYAAGILSITLPKKSQDSPKGFRVHIQ